MIAVSIEYENFLAHHGIKGQKWGVRRYQNDDGTLTPEGRARYLEETERSYNESREINRDARKNQKKMNDYYRQLDKDPDSADSITKFFNKRDPKGFAKARTEVEENSKKQIDASSKAMAYEKKMKAFVESKENITIKEINEYSKSLGEEMGADRNKLLDVERRKLTRATNRSSMTWDGRLLYDERFQANRDQRINERGGKRAQKALDRNIKDRWYEVNNRVAERSKSEFAKVNAKYKNKDINNDPKARLAYLKEMADLDDRLYREEASKIFSDNSAWTDDQVRKIPTQGQIRQMYEEELLRQSRQGK